MGGLISVTTPDGRTLIVNLDYVLKIEPLEKGRSSIVMADGKQNMIVNGEPGDAATAHRIEGK